MNDRAGLAALAALTLGLLGSCLVIDALLDGHYLVTEFAIVATGLSWLGLVGRDAVRAWALERELARSSSRRVSGPIVWYETSALARDAVVAGNLRPRIYVGSAFALQLSEAELEAVLAHEDHHRETRAPLRAIALAAWLVLFGRIGLVRKVLLERLAGLEVAADCHAIRHGSSAKTLARALLKSERCALAAVAYSDVAPMRIANLIEASRQGDPSRPTAMRLPHEWTPIPTLILAAAACQYLV